MNSHSGWHFVWQKRKGSRRLIIRKTRKDDLAGMRVLLVEDNDINMEIAEFYLTDAGINRREKHGTAKRL